MKININELKLNPHNPRDIESKKKEELICSILTFPEMLEYRDIVVDNEYVILGGNQRVSALRAILNMGDNTILSHLKKCNQGDEWAEKKFEFWKKWKQKPEVWVEVASFTEEERKEFIVKDNADFGEWNNEKLNMYYEDIIDLPTMIINEEKVVVGEPTNEDIGLFSGGQEQTEEQYNDEEKTMAEIEDAELDAVPEISSTTEIPSSEPSANTDLSDVVEARHEDSGRIDEKKEKMDEVMDETLKEEMRSIGNNEPNVAKHISDEFVDYIIINKEKIPVTQKEFDSFMDRLEKYLEKYGSPIGFITFLRNGIRNN